MIEEETKIDGGDPSPESVTIEPLSVRVQEFVEGVFDEISKSPAVLDLESKSIIETLSRCCVAVAGYYGIPAGNIVMFPAEALASMGLLDADLKAQAEVAVAQSEAALLLTVSSNIPRLVRNNKEASSLYRMTADHFGEYAKLYEAAQENESQA